MGWMGKIIGFCVGYLFFREVGAVLGLLAGHFVDMNRMQMGGVRMNPQQRFFVQQAYFKATFLIMGHVAKADGRVSEDEIRAARSIMNNMNLTEQQKREAIRLFTQGKQPRFNLSHALEELYNICGDQPMMYRMFIDIQFRAASADGFIGPNKQKILDYICRRFGFNYSDFASFYEHYQYQASGRYQQSSTQQQRQRQQKKQYQQQRQKKSQREIDLENAYKTLGMTKKNSDAEIKKSYRKLMSENHPDKLISKGLPEEMIKLATQKTQEIKSAYDTIKAARGT